LIDRHGHQAAATLLALRPEATLGSFGRASQALFTVFEPGAAVEIDPFTVSTTTFGLTPAEARLAVLIVNGRTPEQCAVRFGYPPQHRPKPARLDLRQDRDLGQAS
jgi:hypothetical protein